VRLCREGYRRGSQYQTKKDDITITISNGVCNLQSIGGAALSSDPNDGVSGSISGLAIACNGHIDARLDIWPHPSCGFDFDGSVSGASASVLIDISDSAGRPILAAGSVSVNIGDFDIHFGGGICGFVANIIKDVVDFFFKNWVNGLVDKEVTSVLQSFINDDANKILAGIPTTIPLHLKAPFDIAEIVFNMTGNPDYGSGFIGLDLLGAIVNTATQQPAPFPSPAIPHFSADSADHYVEIFLSPYVFESGFWVFQQAGLLHYTVNHNIIPSTFPIQLNTTAISIIAPGVVSKFPNEWFEIELVFPANGPPSVNASTSGISAAAPVQLAFNALTDSGPQNAFTLACEFTTALELSVVLNETSGYPAIAGNLSYLECPLSLYNTSVGSVSYQLAAALVDFVLGDVLTPLANVVLHTGIPLPTTDGLTFTNTEIVYGNGYAMAATDFTYSPPSSVIEAAVQSAMKYRVAQAFSTPLRLRGSSN
jgi:hypothetical protein